MLMMTPQHVRCNPNSFTPFSQTGGRLPTHLPGQFYPPTVLAGVNKSMQIWSEEVFGPVRGVGWVAVRAIITPWCVLWAGRGGGWRRHACPVPNGPPVGAGGLALGWRGARSRHAAPVPPGDVHHPLEHRRRGGGAGQRLPLWPGLQRVFGVAGALEVRARGPAAAAAASCVGCCVPHAPHNVAHIAPRALMPTARARTRPCPRRAAPCAALPCPRSIASRLEAGMSTINDFATTYMCQSLPFGGVKHSGFDRFGG